MARAQQAFSLVSCTLTGFTCGTLYLFSAFGPQLGAQLGYTGTQTSLLALAGSIGNSLSGVLASLLVDFKGLAVSVVVGCLCISSGYIGLKDQYDDIAANFPLSSLLMLLVGIGSTFINSAIIKCCAITFPNNRGIATSFPISAYGLSAFVYSFFGSLFFQSNTSGFLAFLGYSPLAVCTLTTPFIYMADKASANAHAVRQPATARNSEQLYRNSEQFELESMISPGPAKPRSPLREEFAVKIHPPLVHTKLDVLRSGKFWKIATIVGILVGMGQIYIYCVGLMVTALLYNSDADVGAEQQFQVSIVSISNCAGRLLCGLLGDIIANTFHKSRNWVLIVPGITLLAVQVLGMKVTTEESLWFVSILNGMGYGFVWSSTPQILIDYFGVNNFSFSWGVIAIAPILPAYVFTHLFGSYYDANLELSDTSQVKICLKGHYCYNQAFLVTTVAGVIVLSIILWDLLKPLIWNHRVRYSNV